LKYLNTDYIDLMQLHGWTDSYNQQLEWYEVLTRLKKQGKFRFFGVSVNDWDPYEPVNLIESGRVDAMQIIYNIFEQRPAEKLFPAALKHAVGIIVRLPFLEGLLTGKIGPGYVFPEGDWRAMWLTPERLEKTAGRLEKLRKFLAPDHPTLTSLALKFCLNHPAVSTVIPGMRKIEHVNENCAASDGKLLKEEVLRELSKYSFVEELIKWKYPKADEMV
jgi:aryl-alcohol dehydrogenase-like predicted oxidoreductase